MVFFNECDILMDMLLEDWFKKGTPPEEQKRLRKIGEDQVISNHKNPNLNPEILMDPSFEEVVKAKYPITNDDQQFYDHSIATLTTSREYEQYDPEALDTKIVQDTIDYAQDAMIEKHARIETVRNTLRTLKATLQQAFVVKAQLDVIYTGQAKAAFANPDNVYQEDFQYQEHQRINLEQTIQKIQQDIETQQVRLDKLKKEYDVMQNSYLALTDSLDPDSQHRIESEN